MPDDDQPQQSFVEYIGLETLTAIVSTVVLSLGFMVFNDYVSPAPNLSGRWLFTVTYEDTNSKHYQDLQVSYETLLIQHNLSLQGTGEKISAISPTIPFEHYVDEERINLKITGSIERKYFSRDELTIHYEEAGKLRNSSTLHKLTHFNEDSMCGCFSSTIADTNGIVKWQRVNDRERLQSGLPVEKMEACKDIRCI